MVANCHLEKYKNMISLKSFGPISAEFYRTGGVSHRRASRSVTRDNAQLPMLCELCSCWPATASVGSGH